MKKYLIYFLFSLILAFSLQNCQFAKIDSIVNNSFEVGFTTINAKARIIDYKDGTPTAHGHCYSETNENPEIGLANTKTTEIPYQNVDFESEIDSLLFDKQYFVRPYMRNGDKIVYGEVQKMSTKTPTIAIKNFVIKRNEVLDLDSLIAETVTSEPLKVPNLLITRDYGLLFCKTPNVSELSISSGINFPALSTNIVSMTLTPSLPILERRNISLKVQLNASTPPNSATGVVFFSTVSTDYYVRAYLRLNTGNITKYYYSDLITLPNQPPSPLKFRIK